MVCVVVIVPEVLPPRKRVDRLWEREVRDLRPRRRWAPMSIESVRGVSRFSARGDGGSSSSCSSNISSSGGARQTVGDGGVIGRGTSLWTKLTASTSETAELGLPAA